MVPLSGTRPSFEIGMDTKGGIQVWKQEQLKPSSFVSVRLVVVVVEWPSAKMSRVQRASTLFVVSCHFGSTVNTTLFEATGVSFQSGCNATVAEYSPGGNLLNTKGVPRCSNDTC